MIAVEFARSRGNFGLPLSREQLASVLGKAWDVQLDKHWAKRFAKRHKKELSSSKGKATAARRKSAKTLKLVQLWLEHFDSDEEFKSAEPCDVLNVDECRLTTADLKSYKLLFDAEQRIRQRIADRTNASACVIPFVAADGSVIATFFVMAGKFKRHSRKLSKISLLASKLAGAPVFYLYNDTGNVNSTTWASILARFCDVWNDRAGGRRAQLFMDNLKAHTKLDVVWQAHTNNVRCLWFAPNVTHYLQPLDQSPFGLFKRLIASKKHTVTQFSAKAGQVNNLTPEDHVALSQEVFEDSFTPRVIKRAFVDTGLVPWDKEKILALARANVGKADPTPQREHIQKLFAAYDDMCTLENEHESVDADVARDQVYTPEQLRTMGQ
jgi:hypothetical protein